MSRSYRKPYSSITGTGSAKSDKVAAHRGVRAAEKQAIRNLIVGNTEPDEFLLPHKYECSHNETYSWGRDGKQRFQSPPALWRYFTGWRYWDEEFCLNRYERAVEWYEKINRK